MKRRDFIRLIGGAAVAWPQTATRAQLGMPVVGYLGNASAELSASAVRAFREGLSEKGYVEGRNVIIEYRWADGQNNRLSALVSDLVRRHVNVIAVPGSTPAALAAKAATATIPVLFQIGSDPVGAGLVDSLARPGGNVTGVTSMNTELGPKRLELLRELIPQANIIALLVNPASPLIAETISKDLQSASRTLGLQLHILNASSESDFDTAFAALVQLRADALVIAPDAMFISRREQLGALTLRHAMPAISQFREFAAAGGLMSYGGSFMEGARQVGVFTGRILRGEKPADLPVQQSTKVELIINLKTAKTLGLTVPSSLLGRADELIE
jgi:putative tryptophan/tyrosine transport system substrate-binding protein